MLGQESAPGGGVHRVVSQLNDSSPPPQQAHSGANAREQRSAQRGARTRLSPMVSVEIPEKSRFFHCSLSPDTQDYRERSLPGKRQREKT